MWQVAVLEIGSLQCHQYIVLLHQYVYTPMWQVAGPIYVFKDNTIEFTQGEA